MINPRDLRSYPVRSSKTYDRMLQCNDRSKSTILNICQYVKPCAIIEACLCVRSSHTLYVRAALGAAHTHMGGGHFWEVQEMSVVQWIGLALIVDGLVVIIIGVCAMAGITE